MSRAVEKLQSKIYPNDPQKRLFRGESTESRRSSNTTPAAPTATARGEITHQSISSQSLSPSPGHGHLYTPSKFSPSFQFPPSGTESRAEESRSQKRPKSGFPETNSRTSSKDTLHAANTQESSVDRYDENANTCLSASSSKPQTMSHLGTLDEMPGVQSFSATCSNSGSGTRPNGSFSQNSAFDTKANPQSEINHPAKESTLTPPNQTPPSQDQSDIAKKFKKAASPLVSAIHEALQQANNEGSPTSNQVNLDSIKNLGHGSSFLEPEKLSINSPMQIPKSPEIQPQSNIDVSAIIPNQSDESWMEHGRHISQNLVAENTKNDNIDDNNVIDMDMDSADEIHSNEQVPSQQLIITTEVQEALAMQQRAIQRVLSSPVVDTPESPQSIPRVLHPPDTESPQSPKMVERVLSPAHSDSPESPSQGSPVYPTDTPSAQSPSDVSYPDVQHQPPSQPEVKSNMGMEDLFIFPSFFSFQYY